MECESYASDRNTGRSIREMNLQEGSDFRCNFYKICETKEYEHYAAYRCVESEQPNFHLPKYFENAVILKRK